MLVQQWKNFFEKGALYVISIGIGLTVGLIDTLFGLVLLQLTAYREAHFLPLVLFLAPVGILILDCFQRFGERSQEGMSLVFEAGQGGDVTIPKRMVPFVVIGTWLAHLVGASVGREGVAVQIGATVGHWFGKLTQGTNQRWFIIIGMAAGFAGLFETPIAATFFALEVLVVGRLYSNLLLPTLLAAFTASWTSQLMGLEKFSFILPGTLVFSWGLLVKLILVAVCFSLAGRYFAQLLKFSKQFWSTKIANPLVRIGLVSLFLSLLFLMFHFGRYSGLGTNLIQSSFAGGSIYSYDWLLKFVLTILTLSIGFPGGEVTPLFAIGATLGVFLASVLGLPIVFIAAFGYIAVFGSATNTLLAPILIGGEVFGWENLPYFILICCISFALNGNHSIYGRQKMVEENILPKD